MIIPSYLRQKGYMDIQLLAELESISYTETDTHINLISPWAELRGVFEYVGCMEHAVAMIDSLPRGDSIAEECVIPARYDSAALVFFAQATLDNLAVWLNTTFRLGMKNTDVSFYSKSKRMLKGLEGIDQEFESVLNRSDVFITRLNNYRMSWLHRVSGGAQIYASGPPGSPGSNRRLMISLMPTLTIKKDSLTFIKEIEELRRLNDGEWLIPVDEFARKLKEGTLELVLDLLRVALKCKLKIVSSHP